MSYELERYKGRSTRHRCPACGDERSFTYYVDENGEPLDPSVGRCDHESGCGYHYTPRMYFADHPGKAGGKDGKEWRRTAKSVPPRRKICAIPFPVVAKSAGYGSGLVQFLCSILDRDTLESPTIERLMEDYALGATKDWRVIYWQIDTEGRVRTGKIMRYDPDTGHRIKDRGGVDWVHSAMRRKGELPEDWELTQCLFGEHLLRMYPDRTVALVESEKSALIGSAVYPDYVWLATGGKSQLSIDKLMVLRGRTVVMFPDVDGYGLWKERAREMTFCRAIVSDVLERNATPEEREAKIDIADWLVRQLRETGTPERDGSQGEGVNALLQCFINMNPALRILVDKFDTVVE